MGGTRGPGKCATSLHDSDLTMQWWRASENGLRRPVCLDSDGAKQVTVTFCLLP